MPTYEITVFCNLNLRTKYAGHRPGDTVVQADEPRQFEADTRLEAAELAFAFWNADTRPNGQTAPSMSVGDVIMVRGPEDNDRSRWRYYSVNSMGFVAIDPPTELVPLPSTTLLDLLNAAADEINAPTTKPSGGPTT